MAVLVYAAIAFAFAPDAVLGDTAFWFHDLRHHHYPWRVWAAEEWAEGHVPWWAPGAANGFPLLAEGQGGFLYVPTMLLFLFLPGPFALTASILGHQLWAALGMHLYAQARGLKKVAPYIAGISWAWGGFMISHTLYLGMQNSLAWMGWLAWATLQRRWGWVALCIAAMGLAGHPQAAAFGGLILGIHAMGVLKMPERLRWVAAAGLGGLMASPQILASLELSQFSMREGGVDSAFANIGAMPPQELINGLLPYFFGYDRPADVPETYYHRGPFYWGSGVNHWEMAFYMGFPMVILALMGARRHRAWALGAALCVLLMMGGPAWALLRHLPGLSFFRFPARFALGLTFAVSILAAEGWAQINLQNAPRFSRRVLAFAGVFFLGAGVLHVGIREAEYPIRQRLNRYFEGQLQQQLPPPPPLSPLTMAALPPPEPEDAARIPMKIDRIFTTLLWSTSPASPGVWWPLASLLLCSVCFRYPRWFPLLIALDLWSFGRNYQGRAPLNDTQAVPTWLAPGMTEAGGWRMTVLDRRIDERLDTEVLSASLGLIYGTQDVILPSPLILVRNDALLTEAGLDIGDRGSTKVQRYLQHIDLARRMGLRYIISTHEIPGLFAAVRGNVNVYMDVGALPRTRVVPCVIGVADAEAAWAALLTADPLRSVVLEGGTTACATGQGEATITKYESQNIEIQATGPGTLILADSWYPRWQAELDGQAVPILRADLLFRGINLPEGTHQIRFYFAPGPAGLALYLSTGLLFSGALWLLWAQWHKYRNRFGALDGTLHRHHNHPRTQGSIE